MADYDIPKGMWRDAIYLGQEAFQEKYGTGGAPNRLAFTLAEAVTGDVVAGIQAACDWMADRLKEDVDIQCPMKPGAHSPKGSPPFRESGDGQRSIKFQRLDNGGAFGTEPLKKNRLDDFDNYMIMHNDNDREWLTNAFDRHREGFVQLMNEVAQARSSK